MKYVAITLVLVFVVVAGWFGYRRTLQIVPVNTEIPLLKKAVEDPFRDMTIPYLRSRDYGSSLGNREVYEKHSDYVSYITNYNSDGLKIQGLLTIPTGKMPEGGWPAIVFVHGYIAPQVYKTTERYVDYVDSLAKKGFVVFKIDLRGNGSSEGEATGAYYSSGYVIDTLNAYAALESSDFVKKGSIGVWGHSMAGNITLRAFAVKPTIPAVVIWAGAGYSYVDLQKYGLSDNSYRPPSTPNTQTKKRDVLMQTHGRPTAENVFWQSVAPTNYLNDLKGAIELHHAVDDPVVSIHYSEDLNTLLDKTKVVHAFYTYPSGGHNISGDSFTVAMQRTISFFKKNLNR